MTYSVWQPKTQSYAYYRSATLPRVPQGGGPLGLTPEQAARPLPIGSRKIGNGKFAKGCIAHSGMGAVESTPNWLLAGGLLVAGYLLIKGLR